MSGDPSAWAKRRLDRLIQRANEDAGIAEKTDYSEEFKSLELKVKRLKDDYKNIIKMTRQFLQPNPTSRIEDAVYDKLELALKDKGAKHPITALGNTLVQTGQGLGDRTMLGGSLIQIGEAQRDLADLWVRFERDMQSKWISKIESYLEVDLKDAEKVRKKLEKARLDLDAHRTKARKNARNLNFTPDSDHRASKDAEKINHLSAKFQRLYFSCEMRYRQLLSETQDGLLLDVIEFLRLQILYHKDSLQRLTGTLVNITDRRSINRKDLVRSHKAGIEGYAIADFTASNQDEVSLRKHDQLLIVDQDTGVDGYWEVLNQGVSGLAPSQCIGFFKAIAVQSFNARTSDELSFNAGDEIVILNKDTGDPDVYYGFRDGLSGFFPASYVSFGSGTGLPSKGTLNAISTDSIDRLAVPSTGRESLSRSASADSFVFQNAHQSIVSNLEDFNNAILASTLGKLMTSSGMDHDHLRDELIGATQKLTMTTRNLVRGANDGTNSVGMLSEVGFDIDSLKQASINMASAIQDTRVQQELLMAATNVTSSLSDLLSALQTGNSAFITSSSKNVATKVGNLMDVMEHAALSISKNTDLNSGVVDAAVDTVQSQTNDQILGYAEESLSEAQKDLAALYSVLAAKSDPAGNMVIEGSELIPLAITLVALARDRQNEVVQQESHNNTYAKNTIWHDGFVSCSKAVADSVISLVKLISQNALHDRTPVMLDKIVAQTAVAISTCRELDYASLVKGVSHTHTNLVACSNQLQNKLTEMQDKTRVARLSLPLETLSFDETSGVKTKAAELEQHERIVAAEAALMAEREKLYRMRKSDYSS